MTFNLQKAKIGEWDEQSEVQTWRQKRITANFLNRGISLLLLEAHVQQRSMQFII